MIAVIHFNTQTLLFVLLRLTRRETLSPISNEIIKSYKTLCKSIPLYPLHNEQYYDKAVAIFNGLLDAGVAGENNPLARLVEIFGLFNNNEHQYEFL